MGTPTQITDHGERGAARLLQQYKDGASIPALVRALSGSHQQIEDVLWDIRLRRAVSAAEGVQLDVLGAIVGQDREGRADAVYRVWILARVRLNKGSGRPEDLLQVFAAITQGTTALVLEEQYPAAIVLKVGWESIVPPEELASLLRLAKAAGVGAVLESATSADTSSFAFDPNGAGFGDATNGALGGTFASAF